MDTTTQYLAILLIGQMITPLTDIINKHVRTANIRWLASWLVASIIAIAANYDQIMVGNVQDILFTTLMLWSSAQSAYRLWYDGSKWQSNIRFSQHRVPFKELVPPVEISKPSLSFFKKA